MAAKIEFLAYFPQRFVLLLSLYIYDNRFVSVVTFTWGTNFTVASEKRYVLTKERENKMFIYKIEDQFKFVNA